VDASEWPDLQPDLTGYLAGQDDSAIPTLAVPWSPSNHGGRRLPSRARLDPRPTAVILTSVRVGLQRRPAAASPMAAAQVQP